MKKVGVALIEAKEGISTYERERSTYERNVWGDVWWGKEETVWGMVYFIIPDRVFSNVSGAIHDYNESVKQGDKEYWIKTKYESNKKYPNSSPVRKCYVARPYGEGDLTGFLKEIDGYNWNGGDYSLRVQIQEKNFDVVYENEILNAL